MKKNIKLITLISTLSLLITSCEFFGFAKYTVTWLNYDGSELEVDKKVSKGTIPSYDGADPEKAGTDQIVYVWTGWTPEVSAVSGDVTYTATFKEETRKYKITWNNYDGQTLRVDDVPYGTVPEYTGVTPEKEQTTEHTYTFNTWSPVLTEVSGDATYTASFNESLRKYKITWKNEDGSVLRTDDVEYSKTPDFGSTDPIKEPTIDQAFIFNGWSPSLNPVSGDAEYTATYRTEVRKYAITWKNYNGTVLKVDDVPYGSMPVFEGDTPVRADKRGFVYTFTGWSPEVEYVTGDAEYVAQFSEKASFSFEPVNYEMNTGYKLSDINGAPWINSNVRGEIEKIKQPSVRDDFYASVNYDGLKNGSTGGFGKSDAIVSQSESEIYSGAASSKTTNGAIIKRAYDQIANGGVSEMSSYFENFDLTSYLNSKESFATKNSLLRIVPSGTGYEVSYNDGYQTGMNTSNYTLLGFLWTFDESIDSAKNIVSLLSSRYGLNFSSEDIDNIATKERQLVYQAWNDYNRYQSSAIYYTVNNLPWAQMKSALLDLGLSSSTRIIVKQLNKACLNSIYNTMVSSEPTLLRNMIVSRLAYDARFLTGVSTYKQINRYISNMSNWFGDESGIYWSGDSTAKKKMARLCFPELMEQTSIQLIGSAETKARVTELIDNVLESYEKLADTSWLGNSTKERMKSKLEHMDYVSCYLDAFYNISKIGGDDVSTKSPYELYRLYSEAMLSEALKGNIDTKGYFNSMPSWTVNAYYSPADNAFVIMNGIVSGMIGTCVEETYGMLAMVIGHEITHAFDSTGSQYDENGNYSNWWSNDDKVTFSNKVNKLKSFYNQIALKKNYYVNGDKVDGEATADLGGMKVALMMAKEVEGFDYDKFFKAYANLWLNSRIGLSDVESRASDSHPFNYLRVNVVVSQFDEFVDTYDVKPGDGMYVPEEERIKVW